MVEQLTDLWLAGGHTECLGNQFGPRSEPVRPEDRARRHRASLYVRSVHDQSHDLIAICASPTMAMPSTPADIMTGPLGTAVMTRTRRGSPWTCASAAVPQSAPATSW